MRAEWAWRGLAVVMMGLASLVLFHPLLAESPEQTVLAPDEAFHPGLCRAHPVR